MSRKKQLYPTVDVLAVAYAALRLNDDNYIKAEDHYRGPYGKYFMPNSSLVRFTIEPKSATYLPEQFVPAEVTDEDRKNAEEALSWCKRYTMLCLGKLTSFVEDMVELLIKEEVSSSDFGRIAYAPVFIRNEQSRAQIKKDFRSEIKNSEHIGTKKDNVSGTLTVIKAVYSKNWGKHFITGLINGNLVSFAIDKKLAERDEVIITAKVKDHKTDVDYKVPLTQLNYVKIKTTENTK